MMRVAPISLAESTAQADRAIAEHDGRIPRLHLGAGRGMIAGRHHIGQRQQRGEHLIGEGLGIAGNYDQSAFGFRNTQVFGLTSHTVLIAEIAAMRAAGFETGLAHRAFAAAVWERNDHKIARLDDGDILPDRFDDADGLMASLAVDGFATIAVEPQIGAAHAGAHHADNRLAAVNDARLRTLLAGHLLDALINRRFHGFPPLICGIAVS